jgi:cell division protein FtsW (lipid II flippase)
LLVLALATTVVAALSYASNTGNEAAQLLLPLSLVGALAVLGHVWMRVRMPSADQTLYCVTLVLMGLGLVMIARLDPSRFVKQVVWTSVAIVALVATATLVRRPEKLGAFQYVCGASAVVLVLLPSILNVVTRGRDQRGPPVDPVRRVLLAPAGGVRQDPDRHLPRRLPHGEG